MHVTLLKHLANCIANPPEPQNPSTTSESGELTFNLLAI
jgi:hypothetical protein